MFKRFIPLLAVTALLSACGHTGGDSIKIGYIGPLTGDAASYGVDTLNGTQLKVEEINAAGGINGQMIELIAEDARCTGVDAASAAQKLINVDKVVAIVGGQCSGETLGAAPIAEAAQVVMMSPVSSSPDVTDAGDFIFRDYPSDGLKTKATAAYFAESGFDKVAIITENTDFAVAFRDALVANLGEDKVVLNEVVEPGTKDFRALITRLNDVEFDVFFPNGQTSAAVAAMMQQLREQGFEQLAVSHDVAQDISMVEIAGDAVEGIQAIGVPEVSESGEFGQKYVAKFGAAQAALLFSAQAYDALGILAEAIGTVGTEGTAIRDYIYDLEYSAIAGDISFDSNGDVVGIPYVLWQLNDGAFSAVQDIPVN